jgi:hypothetical protein
MRHGFILTALLIMLISSGCRTATRTIDEPRVDLDMPQGGNRGYPVGTAPAWEGPNKTVRKMVETEIETPPIWKPAQAPQQPALQAGTAPSIDLTETASTPVEDMPSAAPTEERQLYTK